MAASSDDLDGLNVITLELGDAVVTAIRTTALGNWSYVVSSGDEATVVDPRRDIDIYTRIAETRGDCITQILETHVHSDFVSGGLALAKATGAEIVASRAGKYQFAHRPVTAEDSVAIGDVSLRCIPTPGHTFDHIAWRISSTDETSAGAVLTGGSLLIGGAGRTDLAYDEATPTLTALQYSALRRLAALPDDTVILPTHGGGSACTVGDAPFTHFPTLAEQRVSNSLLSARTLTEFDARLSATRAPAPAYFPHVAALNRIGAPGAGRAGSPEPLGPGAFARRACFGAAVVDARDRWSFAAAHIPGALNIEPFDSFATNVGSVVPFGTPIALVVDERERSLVDDLVAACYRIGYRVEAVLDPGIDVWQEAGYQLESYPAADILEVVTELHAGATPRLLDVRDPVEWDSGTLPGSTTIPLRRLARQAHELRELLAPRGTDGPVLVVCRGGARASVAASFVAKLGIPVRAVLGGGIPDALSALAVAA